MVAAANLKSQARTVVGAQEPESCKAGLAKEQEMLQRSFIGIDVSKARLDVAFRPGGETLSVSNDARGIARLIKIVKNAGPHCVVLEATGGFELMLLEKLSADALPVVVVIHARCGSLRAPAAVSPRPMRSMRRCWPTSRR